MTGRGLAGRRIGQAILLAALLLDGLAAWILLDQPQTMGPHFTEPPSASVGAAIIAAGVILNIVGLAWMVRILRADPEAHASWWRAVRGR